MAKMKRFTETVKWDDPWFRNLKPKQKLLWYYICDKCDNAGVWKVDLQLASMFIGDTVTKEDAMAFNDAVKDRVMFFESDTVLLIRQFVSFQIIRWQDVDDTTKCTNLQKNCIKIVLDYIDNQRLTTDDFMIPDSVLPVLYSLATSIGKGNGKGSLKGFDVFWDAYPRKVGKAKAQAAWLTQNPDIDACLSTLEWQKKHHDWIKDGGKYIPYPSTWLNRGSWDDEQTTTVKPRLVI